MSLSQICSIVSFLAAGCFLFSSIISSRSWTKYFLEKFSSVKITTFDLSFHFYLHKKCGKPLLSHHRKFHIVLAIIYKIVYACLLYGVEMNVFHHLFIQCKTNLMLPLFQGYSEVASMFWFGPDWPFLTEWICNWPSVLKIQMCLSWSLLQLVNL